MATLSELHEPRSEGPRCPHGVEANDPTPCGACILTSDMRVQRAADRKPTNPKDVIGIKKVSMSCVSAPVLAEVALGMMEGALKYGRHNYRDAGIRASVYHDAAYRHLMAWWEGEDDDPNSKAGLHHVSKAIASLTVLRDAMIQNFWNDDRPPKSPAGWMDALNAKAAKLIELHPEPEAPITERT